MEEQQHVRRREHDARRVIEEQQAVAHHHRAEHDRDQHVRLVHRVDQREARRAADQRADDTLRVALLRERIAGLQDDDARHHDPVSVRERQQAPEPEADRHRDRHAQRVPQAWRAHVQVRENQQRRHPALLQEARERLVDLQLGALRVGAARQVAAHLVDEARRAPDPAERREHGRVRFGVGRRELLLAHQLDLVFDRAQFGLHADARMRQPVLEHREADFLEVGGGLADQVAVEDHQVRAAERAAHERVIGVRADEHLMQVDAVDEQVEHHRAARVELAAAQLRQVAQHDVARGFLRLHRGDLPGDEVAVALVEIRVEIVEVRAREQVRRACEQALGERLLLDAARLPARHDGRPVRVPQPARENPRRVDERLQRREFLFERHHHHEQRREADLRPAVAVDDDERQRERERHDREPQREDVRRREPGRERGEKADHAAREHFVVLVLERARHVDDACAERARGDREAELAVVQHDEAQHGGQRHAERDT
ncbi:hypothetical protein X979_6114 [Burkholderia pseudomallei MSHR7527]|nr:hypothetical protein X979_6114 [Burkholderia pseudomallei MSHR7527]